MKKTPPVAQYVVLGLLFFAACAYQVRATIAAFPGFLDRGVAKWPFIPGYSHGEPTAAFVGPEAYKAGVREHDVVTGVNGQPFTGLAVFGEAIAKAKPGDTLEIAIRTPGSNTERTAKIPLTTPSKTIDWAVAAVIMLKVVLPTFSILLGFWVAFVRPRDLAAWLLIGVLLGLSNLFASGIESWGRWVRDLAEFYRTGVAVSYFVVLTGDEVLACPVTKSGMGKQHACSGEYARGKMHTGQMERIVPSDAVQMRCAWGPREVGGAFLSLYLICIFVRSNNTAPTSAVWGPEKQRNG